MSTTFLRGCQSESRDDSIQSISIAFSGSSTSTRVNDCNNLTVGPDRTSEMSMSLPTLTLDKRIGCTGPSPLDDREFCSWLPFCCSHQHIFAIADDVGTWEESNACGGDCTANDGTMNIQLSYNVLGANELWLSIQFVNGGIGAGGLVCSYCSGGFGFTGEVIAPEDLFGTHNFTFSFTDIDNGICSWSSEFSATVVIAP